MPTSTRGHGRSAVAWWRSRTAAAAGRLLQGRFTGLTIVLLVLLFAANALRPGELREIFVGLGFSVLLGFAIWTVRRRLRILTLVLALPALIGHWTFLLSDSVILRGAAFASVTLFLTFLTLVILSAVLRDQAVTADTIVGAVCAYFLLAVTWGTAYALVALVSPDAFSVSPTLSAAAAWRSARTPFAPLMQYYSFSTITTLGYGDITPLTPGARSLSVLEGLTGQLYLAVLIARLVGMHTANAPRR